MRDRGKFFAGIRRVAALVFFVGITLLFLDFTGTLHGWLGWMARVQFLPALLALNAVVVVSLVALTFIVGRVYCSVICPLGVMQDCISWLSGRRTKKRYRFSYSPARNWWRYGFLVLFAVAMAAGIGSVAALLAPYSSYGRIVSGLVSPLYLWINNCLASLAERMDSYAFYEADIWIRSLPVLTVAAVTFVTLAVLSWRNGRTYCNTVCPVGTVLGLLSRHSLFGIRVDAGKCNGCGLCARSCKSSCIDPAAHTVDHSRCVVCMDCVGRCSRGAIGFGLRTQRNRKPHDVSPAESCGESSGLSRRGFLTLAGIGAVTAAVKARERAVDGGLAAIEDKSIPERKTPLVPPGAQGLRHLSRHCTACQLCVSVCPNGVLRPSSRLETLMQPEVSYERGYCRPECVRCSEVCPAGAILPITPADKSAIQRGHAVWVKENCVTLNDGVECGNCARHCPAGAIRMIPYGEGKGRQTRIPAIDTERCIGCGACENLCPARPFSAIYVEGHERHRTI